LAANAAATGTDMTLVFGSDGNYIPKALRGRSGKLEIPQQYTADRSVLGKMTGVARRLKRLNPQLMDINPYTITQFTKKRASKSDWESSVAFYQPLCPNCYGTGKTPETAVGPNFFENELNNKFAEVPCTECVRGISPHIYVSLDFLRRPVIYVDHDEASALNRPEWECKKFTGDFALVLLTCHECAHDLSQYQKDYHHKKDSHGKKWKFWFAKFLHQIIQDIWIN